MIFCAMCGAAKDEGQPCGECGYNPLTSRT